MNFLRLGWNYWNKFEKIFSRRFSQKREVQSLLLSFSLCLSQSRFPRAFLPPLPHVVCLSCTYASWPRSFMLPSHGHKPTENTDFFRRFPTISTDHRTFGTKSDSTAPTIYSYVHGSMWSLSVVDSYSDSWRLFFYRLSKVFIILACSFVRIF